MDSKSSKSGMPSDTYEPAPPAYHTVAGSSGSAQIDAPVVTDAASIKSTYGSVSGINLLTETDTIIVVDDSESMGIYGYWPLVEKVLCHVGPVVAAYDPDGISMYCLNKRGISQTDKDNGIAGQGWNHITNPQDISNIFRSNIPKGTTPIYDRLNHILEPYLLRLARDPNNRPRPINILVLTDGAADDPEGVEEQIGEICTVLDKYDAPNNQIGLQFVQIGDLAVAEAHIRQTVPPNKVDETIRKAYSDYEAAKAWLNKLDDDLKGGIEGVTRDIVDTKDANELLAEGGFNPKTLVKILVGALSKRHDRMV